MLPINLDCSIRAFTTSHLQKIVYSTFEYFNRGTILLYLDCFLVQYIAIMAGVHLQCYYSLTQLVSVIQLEFAPVFAQLTALSESCSTLPPANQLMH